MDISICRHLVVNLFFHKYLIEIKFQNLISAQYKLCGVINCKLDILTRTLGHYLSHFFILFVLCYWILNSFFYHNQFLLPLLLFVAKTNFLWKLNLLWWSIILECHISFQICCTNFQFMSSTTNTFFL